MSNAALIGTSEAVIAIVATLGFIAALVGWFARRGADEKSVELALKGQEVALSEATLAIRDLTKALDSFRSEALQEFRALDVRLTRLEANENGNSAHRNAGSPSGH